MDAKHIEFMRQALLESKKALPECLPNPPVGCVLVKGGMVLAKGYRGFLHVRRAKLGFVS